MPFALTSKGRELARRKAELALATVGIKDLPPVVRELISRHPKMWARAQHCLALHPRPGFDDGDFFNLVLAVLDCSGSMSDEARKAICRALRRYMKTLAGRDLDDTMFGAWLLNQQDPLIVPDLIGKILKRPALSSYDVLDGGTPMHDVMLAALFYQLCECLRYQAKFDLQPGQLKLLSPRIMSHTVWFGDALHEGTITPASEVAILVNFFEDVLGHPVFAIGTGEADIYVPRYRLMGIRDNRIFGADNYEQSVGAMVAVAEASVTLALDAVRRLALESGRPIPL